MNAECPHDAFHRQIPDIGFHLVWAALQWLTIDSQICYAIPIRLPSYESVQRFHRRQIAKSADG